MQPYGSFLLDNKTKISSSMSQQSFNDVLKESNGQQPPAASPTAEEAK